MEFLKKYKQQIIFKIIALVALLFLYIIYNNNFAVCPSVRSIECSKGISLPEGIEEIPEEYRCLPVKDKECCIYIYPDNPQCYLVVLKQSILGGVTGSLLMIFAELFYFITLVIYMIFPFLTRFILYEGYTLRDPKEAAQVSAEVFAKAIYFITPILLLLILLALYRNLPYFI